MHNVQRAEGSKKCLLPGEAEKAMKEQVSRQRRLRMLQVREQSKAASREIRENVQKEKEKQLGKLRDSVKKSLEEEKENKLLKLSRLYHESLNEIGSGWRAAQSQGNILKEVKAKAKLNSLAASERGRYALSEFWKEDNKKKEEANRPNVFRKFALDMEKERAAEVASRPPPPPDPLEFLEDNTECKTRVVLHDQKIQSLTSTYQWISSVEKADPEEQEDARKTAIETMNKQHELEVQKSELQQKWNTEAETRFNIAWNKEKLNQECEDVMKDIEKAERLSRNQDYQNPANIQKFPILYSPLVKKIRKDKQIRMENAVEKIIKKNKEYEIEDLEDFEDISDEALTYEEVQETIKDPEITDYVSPILRKPYMSLLRKESTEGNYILSASRGQVEEPGDDLLNTGWMESPPESNGKKEKLRKSESLSLLLNSLRKERAELSVECNELKKKLSHRVEDSTLPKSTYVIDEKPSYSTLSPVVSVKFKPLDQKSVLVQAEKEPVSRGVQVELIERDGSYLDHDIIESKTPKPLAEVPDTKVKITQTDAGIPASVQTDITAVNKQFSEDKKSTPESSSTLGSNITSSSTSYLSLPPRHGMPIFPNIAQYQEEQSVQAIEAHNTQLLRTPEQADKCVSLSSAIAVEQESISSRKDSMPSNEVQLINDGRESTYDSTLHFPHHRFPSLLPSDATGSSPSLLNYLKRLSPKYFHTTQGAVHSSSQDVLPTHLLSTDTSSEPSKAFSIEKQPANFQNSFKVEKEEIIVEIKTPTTSVPVLQEESTQIIDIPINLQSDSGNRVSGEILHKPVIDATQTDIIHHPDEAKSTVIDQVISSSSVLPATSLNIPENLVGISQPSGSVLLTDSPSTHYSSPHTVGNIDVIAFKKMQMIHHVLLKRLIIEGTASDKIGVENEIEDQAIESSVDNLQNENEIIASNAESPYLQAYPRPRPPVTISKVPPGELLILHELSTIQELDTVDSENTTGGVSQQSLPVSEKLVFGEENKSISPKRQSLTDWLPGYKPEKSKSIQSQSSSPGSFHALTPVSEQSSDGKNESGIKKLMQSQDTHTSSESFQPMTPLSDENSSRGGRQHLYKLGQSKSSSSPGSFHALTPVSVQSSSDGKSESKIQRFMQSQDTSSESFQPMTPLSDENSSRGGRQHLYKLGQSKSSSSPGSFHALTPVSVQSSSDGKSESKIQRFMQSQDTSSESFQPMTPLSDENSSRGGRQHLYKLGQSKSSSSPGSFHALTPVSEQSSSDGKSESKIQKLTESQDTLTSAESFQPMASLSDEQTSNGNRADTHALQSHSKHETPSSPAQHDNILMKNSGQKFLESFSHPILSSTRKNHEIISIPEGLSPAKAHQMPNHAYSETSSSCSFRPMASQDLSSLHTVKDPAIKISSADRLTFSSQSSLGFFPLTPKEYSTSVSSSEENLTNMFTGSKIAYQSTPVKLPKQFMQEVGILEEPDLTLVGSEISGHVGSPQKKKNSADDTLVQEGREYLNLVSSESHFTPLELATVSSEESVEQKRSCTTDSHLKLKEIISKDVLSSGSCSPISESLISFQLHEVSSLAAENEQVSLWNETLLKTVAIAYSEPSTPSCSKNTESNSQRPPNVQTSSGRKTVKKDFKTRTKRLWNNLEEVKEKKIAEERKKTYAQNREKAKEFQMKLQKSRQATTPRQK